MAESHAVVADPVARVRAVLELGRRLADPSQEEGRAARRRLTAESGLSPEGVALALGEHLETEASDEELARFVGRAAPCSRAAVVLSANVCTGALRAIAFGLATAPRVLVKPSRRDPSLAELLAEALPGVSLVPSLEAALAPLAPGEELHVYGSDETIAVAAPLATARGVVLRGHGTGFGVAAIGREASVAGAAERLARDLVPFDGRGCLSPRLALVEGDAERARALAEATHRALERLGGRIPRGEASAAERREVALFRRTHEVVGEVFVGAHHVVALDPEPESLAPAPALRAVTVAPLEAARVPARLAALARWITCVGDEGDSELGAAVGSLAQHARRSRLGAMQRPPFDGPVDLRRQVPTNTRDR
ncbi:MAG: proline dehydrogenase [Deltaproteobacteria bacterium]|nr:proline dehydrogenase [Deltaproteobacteria bacterium]